MGIPWKYYAVTHAHHGFMNPMRAERFDRMIGLLDLPAGARVLDIGCGKAELLCRIAAHYADRGVTGLGVDASEYEAANATNAVAARGLAARIEIRHQHGGELQLEPASVDLACCIGASFAFGGHVPTLRALAAWTAPGGLVWVGEPFWLREPDPEYLAAEGMARDDFSASHRQNILAAEPLGLRCVYSVTSDQDEWDHYEWLQEWAADRWAAANPDDPDRDSIMAMSRKYRDIYTRWGRDTLGWGLYLFRRQPG